MKPNNFNTTAKSLTGFGPASSSDKHLKSIDAKVSFNEFLFQMEQKKYFNVLIGSGDEQL